MPRDRLKRALAAAALCAACRESPGGPQQTVPVPVRDALFQRLDDGGVYLIGTDGSRPRRVTPPGGAAYTPIAVTDDGGTIALLGAGTISLAPLEDLGAARVIDPAAPSLVGPAAFSLDGRLLAVPAELDTVPLLLLYDRSLREWDTIRVGGQGIFGAPAFSADGAEIIALSITSLTMSLIHLDVATGQVVISRIGDSRVLNAPLFGWPRWSPELGFVFLVRHGLATPARDTLAVMAMDPAHPESGLDQLYQVLMAPDSASVDVVFAPYSSYSLTPGAELLILAAQPDSASQRHALYAAARGEPRIRSVLDSPPQFPVYPQLLR